MLLAIAMQPAAVFLILFRTISVLLGSVGQYVMTLRIVQIHASEINHILLWLVLIASVHIHKRNALKAIVVHRAQLLLTALTSQARARAVMLIAAVVFIHQLFQLFAAMEK
jgi:hypothetical protein